MQARFEHIPGELVKVQHATLHVVERPARMATHLPPSVLIHGKFGSVHDFLDTSLVDLLTSRARRSLARCIIGVSLRGCLP